MDAERLLGSLLRQGLRGSRRGRRRRRSSRSGLSSLLGGGTLTTVAGLGALGVAIAAFDHYTQKKSQPAGPVPPAPGSVPPPPPPGRPTPPPSAPDSIESRTETSPPASGAATFATESEALLLIRAMIAAANADGQIDAKERETILARFEETGMTAEERGFIEKELAHPPSIDTLLSGAEGPELANRLYTVSLLAIDVDTKAEKDYLAYLRARLGLDPAIVEKLHQEFEVPD